MGFWDLGDGTSAKDVADYKPDGGGFLIPNNSNVIAEITAIGWETGKAEYGSPRYIKAEWTVTQPVEYVGRKIPQSFWVADLNPNQAAKGREKQEAKKRKDQGHLAAIDKLCGGKLLAKDTEPSSDDLLIALGNKPMTIKVMLMSNPASDGSGNMFHNNWIGWVGPASTGVSISKEPIPERTAGKPKAQTVGYSGGGGSYSGAGRSDLDDEIPF